MNDENRRKRCEVLLIAMLGRKLAAEWWDRPNKAFDGLTPQTAYITDPDKVYQYLMRSSEGEW